jgi:O-antigen/teichoic acid export membrane protein
MLAMTGNATLNTVNSLVYLALVVGLDVALIPSHGIQGAAVAVFGATLVLNLLRTIQVRWVFGFWPFDAHVLKPIAAASAAGLACLATQSLLADFGQWFVLFFGTGALATTYSFCLLALGISEEDRIILKAIGKKFSFFGRAISRLH